MDKVYLLLRNNVEAGPYTYEELLQQDLLPTDLIWVEGESTMWLQPADLKEEKPVVPILPGNHADHTPKGQATIPVPQVPWYLKRRSEEAELEAKAIALKEQAEAAVLTTQHYQYQAKTFKPSKRNPVVYQEEETPLLLEIHRANKQSVTLPQLIAAGVITALVTTGWYNRDKLSIVRPQASIISQAATPVIFQVIPPPAPKVAVVSTPDTINTTIAAAASPATAPVKSSTAFNQQQPAAVNAAKKVDSTPALQQSPVVIATEKKEEKLVIANSQVVEKKEEPEVSNSDVSAETVSTAPAKKKGLGQALKNIFKKKKRTEETAEQE
jgi:hypothetical protein